jgi:site-specific DNA recombinase
MPIRKRREMNELSRTATLYCRVSTVGQEEDGTSLVTQEEYCRKYAADHGYALDETHVYREVYSGTELWERRQLTELREAIRQKAIRAVIAYAIDRLSRDPAHLGVILSEAEHHGVAVEFVTEPLDNSPEGQLIRFVRGYVAKVEAEKIRERSLRGKRARVQAGKVHNHGPELYGYRRDKAAGTRTIYEPEAAIVRQIFQWYVDEHHTFRAIARRLNEQGISSPAVNKIAYPDPDRRPRWGRGQLLRILQNPTYKGEAIGWRYTRGGRLRPDTDWIRLPTGTVPAIIPPRCGQQPHGDWRRITERMPEIPPAPISFGAALGVPCVIIRCTRCRSMRCGRTGVPHVKKPVALAEGNVSGRRTLKRGCGHRSARFCKIRRSLPPSCSGVRKRAQTLHS